MSLRIRFWSGATRPMNAMPETSWTFENSTSSREPGEDTRMRRATTNQMNAMAANGIRYNPARITHRRSGPP